MKNILMMLALLISAYGASAQEENKNKNPQEYKTLFGGDHTTHGGYGALMVNYSKIDNQDAVLVGAKGAWIINHGIGIGIAGYGFVNDKSYEKTINGYTGEYTLAGGYGGLLIEPILWATKPIHVAIPVIIGAGGVSYIANYMSYSSGQPEPYHHYYPEEADAFFVIEPGLEIELNLVKFMRLTLGGYYRYTSNLDLPGSSSDMLNGFSGGIGLKFGKF